MPQLDAVEKWARIGVHRHAIHTHTSLSLSRASPNCRKISEYWPKRYFAGVVGSSGELCVSCSSVCYRNKISKQFCCAMRLPGIIMLLVLRVRLIFPSAAWLRMRIRLLNSTTPFDTILTCLPHQARLSPLLIFFYLFVSNHWRLSNHRCRKFTQLAVCGVVKRPTAPPFCISWCSRS